MAIILGVDPGSRICGYGLVNATSQGLEYVASGCIKVAQLEFPERLRVIHDALNDIIESYHPVEAAIESIFMGRNASSALKLGQARGAAIVALMRHDLLPAEYSATKVKRALAGSGRAEKAQLQHMIVSLLSLSDTPQSDAADALSVAICHAHTQHGLVKLAAVRALRRGQPARK